MYDETYRCIYMELWHVNTTSYTNEGEKKLTFIRLRDPALLPTQAIYTLVSCVRHRVVLRVCVNTDGTCCLCFQGRI